jgi:hypothetical protein
MCNVAATIIAEILDALRYNMYSQAFTIFFAHERCLQIRTQERSRNNGLLKRASRVLILTLSPSSVALASAPYTYQDQRGGL